MHCPDMMTNYRNQIKENLSISEAVNDEDHSWVRLKPIITEAVSEILLVLGKKKYKDWDDLECGIMREIKIEHIDSWYKNTTPEFR
ncbi:hypothetical protein TNCT_122351 [Trichonephila clavata]|uniref:Uncharacterized protein n=1 Tax=Trichonephila clavata TaxID=2740835 RepID=A0A8X6FBD6_TRICU|nr:hypothetical protein TNCT_122351 [Trichonephila clavata]